MKTFKCPCCGQDAAAPVSPEQLPMLITQPVRSRIIKVLVGRMDRMTTSYEIADQIYADRTKGGPSWASNTVSVMIRRIKPTLERYGWTILGMPGVGVRLSLLESTHATGSDAA
jgi:DNA-binding response OmpR family regulator